MTGKRGAEFSFNKEEASSKKTNTEGMDYVKGDDTEKIPTGQSLLPPGVPAGVEGGEAKDMGTVGTEPAKVQDPEFLKLRQ